FAPVMLAYALALVAVKGWPMLPVLPALLAFLVMITALTYQFQGWLAALMSNPRRRRTVIVVATMVFILIVQLPNLLNYFTMGGVAQRNMDRLKSFEDETEALNRTAAAQKSDPLELARRRHELLQKFQQERQEEFRVNVAWWEHTTRLANEIIPFGWL